MYTLLDFFEQYFIHIYKSTHGVNTSPPSMHTFCTQQCNTVWQTLQTGSLYTHLLLWQASCPSQLEGLTFPRLPCSLGSICNCISTEPRWKILYIPWGRFGRQMSNEVIAMVRDSRPPGSGSKRCSLGPSVKHVERRAWQRRGPLYNCHTGSDTDPGSIASFASLLTSE